MRRKIQQPKSQGRKGYQGEWSEDGQICYIGNEAYGLNEKLETVRIRAKDRKGIVTNNEEKIDTRTPQECLSDLEKYKLEYLGNKK